MRNTIILGTLIAVLGLGSMAQASDDSNHSDDGVTRVSREASNDGRRDRHHRFERGERSRDRESREHRRSSNEKHDGNEVHEGREHR